MDTTWLTQVSYWHWWVLGVILIILEVFSPAAFFMWLGLAAGAVGFLLLAVPDLAWTSQIMAFALFSVASIALGRSYLKRRPIRTDHPTLNRRGEQYRGRTFTLDRPIVDGVGKLKVDDTTWKISGPDCPAGSKVQVTGVDGVVLEVRCPPPPDPPAAPPGPTPSP